MLDSLPGKLRSKISENKETGCWDWVGYRTHAGYGTVGMLGARVYVHRAVWSALNGPIPLGMVLDHFILNKLENSHRCSRACCNPAHLRVVTQGENIKNSENFQRSFAKKLARRRSG